MRSSILQKSVQILSILSQVRRPLRLKEIIELSGYQRSSVHRLLGVLQAERLVQFDSESKCYSLGSKLFEIAEFASENTDLRSIAMGDLVKLQQATGFNVALGELRGTDVVGLCFLEGEGQWNRHHRPGLGEPAYCSATGKVLLAYLDPERLAARLQHLEMRKLTPRTITTRNELQAALQETRRAGFAVNDREEHDHIVGVAVPVFNQREDVVAAISVFSVIEAVSLRDLVGIIEEIQMTATRISERLAGKLS